MPGPSQLRGGRNRECSARRSPEVGRGRFSFHFPFHLSTHRRAREGGEPLFLNQTGKIVQRPGLAPVTRERGLSGVQRFGFGQGLGRGRGGGNGGRRRLPKANSEWGKLVLWQPGQVQRLWRSEGLLCATEQPRFQSTSCKCSMRVLRRRRGDRGQKKRTVSVPLLRPLRPRPQRSA